MADKDDDTVQCLTTKEIKALARPEFAANPEKFYPTETFAKMGYSRAQCPCCQNYYWRFSEKADTCGDSNCRGKYSFINNGIGKKTGKKTTFAEAWKGFEDSFTSARIPCTSIKRYPIVARWRNDVDFVAAGIFCFQPYCVTGELDPPANPLICPQFCARFNDLDNIGLTGRHYSGFIMMGIQVFNLPNDYKFFKDECLEFNHRWLTETLEIDPDEITYIEDVWAGGGNLGPSIEYFVHGLEVGNMVFMQYKTFHDGSREELDVKVIDVGIGLERIAWLYNGSATSYSDTFANALSVFQNKVNVPCDQELWEKYGPYSCTLNIDEVEDVEAEWKALAERIGESVEKVKDGIQNMKDVFIILDHTRTILICISDGSLPSNVGGGGNVRNILRRVFFILKKNDWWDKVGGIDGLLEVFESHKLDLEGIYGKFPEYKSFAEIIKVEHDRWLHTDDVQADNLKKLLAKKKNKLSIDDWIMCIQSWGIAADKISEVAKVPIPGNLYYEIATRQERVGKKAETILYSTVHLPETENLYYKDNKAREFEAEGLTVFANVLQNGKRNLVILNKSAFYPTSGGQQNDIGKLKIGEETYNVVDVIKVGKVVMHQIDGEIAEDIDIAGMAVHGEIDWARRTQLMSHHTGTHVVFAACRQALGPHIWQAGAKKTPEQAHLDITHYKSLTKDEEMAIENTANRLINSCVDISKGFMDKSEAELQYGFSLYQGGVVPGNQLRVVSIQGVDTEACCGTHADNTAEVGWIRILKTQRISDGIVRLYYVARDRAIEVMNSEAKILNNLCDTWGVDQAQIEQTASRFFNEYKRLGNQTKKQDSQILNLQIKLLLSGTQEGPFFCKSDQDDPTLYISFLPQFAEELKEKKKGIVFCGSNFCAGLLGSPDMIKFDELKTNLQSFSKKEVNVRVNKDKVSFKPKNSKKAINTTGVHQFMISGGDMDVEKMGELLLTMGLTNLE